MVTCEVGEKVNFPYNYRGVRIQRLQLNVNTSTSQPSRGTRRNCMWFCPRLAGQVCSRVGIVSAVQEDYCFALQDSREKTFCFTHSDTICILWRLYKSWFGFCIIQRISKCWFLLLEISLVGVLSLMLSFTSTFMHARHPWGPVKLREPIGPMGPAGAFPSRSLGLRRHCWWLQRERWPGGPGLLQTWRWKTETCFSGFAYQYGILVTKQCPFIVK